ncbi:MAG: hypothetical protein Q4B26_19035, partial [Eubacteriales bacterium]|nr:hypothetical protein [Eubacteriales bacterium]
MRISKIGKRMIAVICSVALLAGGLSAFATNTESAQTEDTPWSDYTRITLADYGIDASTDTEGT